MITFNFGNSLSNSCISQLRFELTLPLSNDIHPPLHFNFEYLYLPELA